LGKIFLSKATRPFLSIVVLAYNEEGGLAENVAPILQWVQQLDGAPPDIWPAESAGDCGHVGPAAEIVIVNDGSSDRTAEIAEGISEQNDCVRVVHHPENKGMGATVRSGYAAAEGFFVTQLPADGQVRPETLELLLPHLDQVDMVLSVYKARDDGFKRKVLSKGFQTLVRALYGLDGRITGTMILKKSVLDLFPTHANTFFANLELPFRLIRAGIRHKVVEIEAVPRTTGASKVANPRRIARVTREMVGIRLRHWRGLN
jgi:glycosyltransferase involved in cell wall biosynthesis